jgi:predicted extracellular nuclease
MKKSRIVLYVFLISAVLVSGCQIAGADPTAAPSPRPTTQPPEPARILISEVLASGEDSNDREFIELYNTSPTAPLDLDGMTLWYQLEEGEEERILYRWTETTLIPPRGHYLLGRAGQDYQVVVDARYDLPLANSRGGLLLRNPDDSPADSLAWGGDPQKYGEGSRAPALERGVSLERKPGGPAGSGVDTDHNSRDFVLNDRPDPQGSDSPLTPARAERLQLGLAAPAQVNPGEEFVYRAEMSNLTEKTLDNLTAVIQLPTELEVVNLPAGMDVNQGRVTWQVDQLSSRSSARVEFTVRAPWTYLTAEITGALLQSPDWPVPAVEGPVRTRIAGGAVPVAVARDLLGNEVVVEGVATMYTGGYYAGSGNTKFYLEDETHGLQVWIPDGAGEVEVGVGDRVRVKGVPELYRGAVELVTEDPADVEILQQAGGGDQPLPEEVSLAEVVEDKENLAGRLARVEGEIIRVEEFSYSYEIDLEDDTGQVLTLYVDKNTNLTVEHLEVGDHYRASGILEIRDAAIQLYPRLAEDLEKIYPPILRLAARVPATVPPGEEFRVTLTAFNHTPETLHDLEIRFQVPDQVRVVEIEDQGELGEQSWITWARPELPGNGASAAVSVRLAGLGGAYVRFDQAQASAEEWAEPAEMDLHYTFFGELIPIWAVQGPAFRSPYLLDEVKTTGIVTAVFPELGGFWIQERQTDRDPRTSPGVFVHTGGLNADVEIGNRVRVKGTARETYQQTQIRVRSLGDVQVLEESVVLPEPVELDPPDEVEAAAIYFEALEGSLVQVTQPATAVAPSSKYGEYVIVLDKHGVSRLWTADPSGLGIMVDDGSEREHEYRDTLPYVIGVGDGVTDLAGVLAYTYGNYKIEPLNTPALSPVEKKLPELEIPLPGDFSAATWNVENLFDVVLPHPSDPDLPTVSEYEIDLKKVANTILAAGAPTVVGLQEVENLEILEDLTADGLLGSFGYQPYLIEGTDSRGIDVGYLVRTDQVEVVDVRQFPAPEGLTSRPPLMVQLEVVVEEGTRTIFVLNNHFTSMSGGEEATEPRRTGQALWNVKVLEELREEFPEADFLVLGDLNSYYFSAPIDALREAGLEHVFELLPEDEKYNYIYQGQSQVLDHILVNAGLWEQLRRVTILHTNADYPLPEPGDPSPLRKSDHDLVLAVFDLETD